AHANGPVQITVTLRDGHVENGSSTRTFTVNIASSNDAPTLVHLADQTMNEDAILQLPVVVQDVDNDAADVVLSASASDAAIIPPGGLTFGGTGVNRTLRIQPATNQFGSVTVMIT